MKDAGPRAQWDNRVLTLIGFAVELGNVWRYLYFVKGNGRGEWCNSCQIHNLKAEVVWELNRTNLKSSGDKS